MAVEAIGDAALGDDWAWLRLEAEGERIAAAAGEGEGAAELARAVRGLTLLEAAAVPGPLLALDALHDALAGIVRGRPAADRVVVAMSGGVDSAVALLAAREAGLRPVGATLRLWVDPAGSDGERACCSPRSVRAARSLCHELGVPHVTLDLRERFRARVVAPFVAGYARGETPNPCVRCNGSFRFDELASLARRLGAPRLATGHYARIVERDGQVLVARGVDPDKDQSYMLARVAPRVLGRLWLPLGERTKAETRARAAAAGLAAARRPESQEACFLGGADYRAFLSRQGLAARPGPLVDPGGEEVGRHDGYWRFTPGQRRGIGVASADGPLYALSVDPRRNLVRVGPREALARREVVCRDGRLRVQASRVEVALRSRSPAVPGRVETCGRGFRLTLDEPAYGVAPGQLAALYVEDAIVGAGTVARSA